MKYIVFQKRKLPTSDEIILKRKQNTSKKKMCLSATDPIIRTATNSSVHFIAFVKNGIEG